MHLNPRIYICKRYSKICVNRPLSNRPKNGFQEQVSLNAGRKYGRMSSWSILQCFRPSLSYHLLLRYLFRLYLSGRFTQVLLYWIKLDWLCQKISIIIINPRIEVENKLLPHDVGSRSDITPCIHPQNALRRDCSGKCIQYIEGHIT